jgi:hypothetical protein
MTTRYSPTTRTFYPWEFAYGSSLPADVIEVSDADYRAAMLRPTGHEFAFDPSGQLVITAPPAPTLDQTKAAKLAELAAEFSKRMAAVKAGYPNEEVLSWAEQKAEASAYSADMTAPSPLLSSMASARGITVADLAARVLANAQAWSVASGALIGKRQAYEDKVDAATDASTVAAIAWTD